MTTDYTTSMEQVIERAEATVVNHCFSLPTENISAPVCLWTRGKQTGDCFVTSPQSPSRGFVHDAIQITAAITVTSTQTKLTYKQTYQSDYNDQGRHETN